MSWEPSYTVNRFEDLVALLSPLLPSTSSTDDVFWFRGQANKCWGLEPSFMRTLGGSQMDPQVVVGLENEALKAFSSKAHLFVSPPLLAKVRTIPCWWALMQHHNAPTRLLDWTTSPYVAAYFASRHGGVDADGAVWCFCKRKLRSRFTTLPPFESPEAPGWYEDKLALGEEGVVAPLEFTYPSSERCAAQQGKFTMSFKASEQHDCIEQIGTEYVRKLIIPREIKPNFLLRLQEMNITGAALFPGVDGLGESVKELISLGALYGKTADAKARELTTGALDGRTADAKAPKLTTPLRSD
jgi:FRG domain